MVENSVQYRKVKELYKWEMQSSRRDGSAPAVLIVQRVNIISIIGIMLYQKSIQYFSKTAV
jgi:hypothetical protein